MNIFTIISIICFALCLVMFFYLRWYIKKRVTFSGLEDRKAELAQILNEIDRITDRDAQLIEDRVNQLKELLHDVDKRIAIYEREMENSLLLEKNRDVRKNETLYSNLGKGIRAALVQPLDTAAEISSQEVSHNTPRIAAQDVPSASETRSQNITAGSSAPSPLDANISCTKSEEDNKPSSKMQIRSSIDKLADEGFSAEEIANRLNISAAEVNLAMNLSVTRRKN